MSGLYLEQGYLDQLYVYKTAVGSGCSFAFEVGGRQVGKTYGAVQLSLESKEPFVLLRRTKAEADFVAGSSPFEEHDPTISIQKGGAYKWDIMKDGHKIGIICGLSSIAKMRGFSWHEVKRLIYDEYIPERHVARIRDEGAAFVNAMITIGGNRELNGEPPVFVWCLANPNIHANPVNNIMGITGRFDRMETDGKEISVLREKRIVCVKPSSEALMERRRNIAIFQAIDPNSEVYRMAVGNEFAFDDKSLVAGRNLKEYTASASVMKHVTVWHHKSSADLYITECVGEIGSVYYDNQPDKDRFRTLWAPVIRNAEINKRVRFSTLVVQDAVHKLLGVA